jgi:hypothetical protein
MDGDTRVPRGTNPKLIRHLELLAEPADRVASHELRFLDAVDLAYDAAVWSGLTEAVGDDLVQARLAAAFAGAGSARDA